jgi:hypothetical protein
MCLWSMFESWLLSKSARPGLVCGSLSLTPAIYLALCTYRSLSQAGLNISGINSEVLPGQWEFQIGPVPALELGDEVSERGPARLDGGSVGRCFGMRVARPRG